MPWQGGPYGEDEDYPAWLSPLCSLRSDMVSDGASLRLEVLGDGYRVGLQVVGTAAPSSDLGRLLRARLETALAVPVELMCQEPMPRDETVEGAE